MTPAQHARLGPIARAIVDADRTLAATRAELVDGNVVRFRSIGQLRDYRDLIRDRRVMRSRADEIFGKPLRGDGSGRA